MDFWDIWLGELLDSCPWDFKMGASIFNDGFFKTRLSRRATAYCFNSKPFVFLPAKNRLGRHLTLLGEPASAAKRCDATHPATSSANANRPLRLAMRKVGTGTVLRDSARRSAAVDLYPSALLSACPCSSGPWVLTRSSLILAARSEMAGTGSNAHELLVICQC